MGVVGFSFTLACIQTKSGVSLLEKGHTSGCVCAKRVMTGAKERLRDNCHVDSVENSINLCKISSYWSRDRLIMPSDASMNKLSSTLPHLPSSSNDNTHTEISAMDQTVEIVSVAKLPVGLSIRRVLDNKPLSSSKVIGKHFPSVGRRFRIT